MDRYGTQWLPYGVLMYTSMRPTAHTSPKKPRVMSWTCLRMKNITTVRHPIRTMMPWILKKQLVRWQIEKYLKFKIYLIYVVNSSMVHPSFWKYSQRDPLTIFFIKKTTYILSYILIMRKTFVCKFYSSLNSDHLSWVNKYKLIVNQ